MLREVTRGVSQDQPHLKRRWFQSEYFDLFTWQSADAAVTSFQLCYDIQHNERALVWKSGVGFFHDGVDGGGDSANWMSSPIYVPDGKFDSGTVFPRFTREAAQIPAEVRDFVLAKIREYLLLRHQLRGKRLRVRREAWQRRKPDTEELT